MTSPIPVIGQILALVGFVLVLAALKVISNKANNSKIFTNAIIGIVLVAIGLLAGIIIFIPSIVVLIYGNTTAMTGSLIGIILGYVLTVTGFVIFRNALRLVANFTGVSLFNTAGIMFLIGSILIIIFIGTILAFIGWILLAIAFFSIPDEYKTAENT
ncbi:MAG: DUF996 domain-containing protein [Hydrogenothermaceae bacterium]